MMRARFEPVSTSGNFFIDDTELDRMPPPPPPVHGPRGLPPRVPKPIRHTPPPAIGTRTLGRTGHKQPSVLKTHNEYGITLLARPDPIKISDAFLIVLEVVEESSSWNQGLRSRDLFVNFGGLTKDLFAANGSNLECLLPIVTKSLKSPLECTIIRGQRLFNITLKGMRWEHGVCLGAVINTYPEPVPLSRMGCMMPDAPTEHQTPTPQGRPTSSNDQVQNMAVAFQKQLSFNPADSVINNAYR